MVIQKEFDGRCLEPAVPWAVTHLIHAIFFFYILYVNGSIVTSFARFFFFTIRYDDRNFKGHSKMTRYDSYVPEVDKIIRTLRNIVKYEVRQ